MGRNPTPPGEDDDLPPDSEATVIWVPPEWIEGDPASAAGEEPAVRPDVEVDVRSVTSDVALAQQRKRVYEIWTRNRVYSVDATMRCVEVIDLASGREEANHPFLGARLVGGQTQESDKTVLTFPLPVAGTEAVFQRADERQRIKLAVTSRVTRVVLHVQRVRVEPSRRDQHWGRITRR